jgi:TonB family protein
VTYLFKISNAQNQTRLDESKNDSKNYNQKADLIETREFVVKDGIYDVVEDMPRFPGGEYALMNYLQKNTKYPESKTEIHGTVIVHFEVTKTGEIGRVEIFKSLDPAFDYEAVRVVKSLPKWTPGKYNGEYVNVWYTLPIKFMLNQPEIRPTIAGATLEIYESVKQMPQFPGGENELLNYITKNMMYPLSAKQKGIQGNVYVRFIVTETGKLDHIEVVRPLTPDCDAEAVRLVKNSPEWTPGKLDGKNVNVYYTISVSFKLK